MRVLVLAVALLGGLLAGCGEQQAAKPLPPPHTLTATAVGKYCGMTLVEHPGPKGQILLAGQAAPVWFSSARDAIAFTLLPEEAKDIRAIYVSDMAKAPGWTDPGPDNWVEARSAVFVIGSQVRGGMGAEETVPFSDRGAAERFVAEHDGRLVSLAEIPRDYVLGSGEPAGAAAPDLAPAAGSPAAGPPAGHGH
ncbi:MAG: nitrous oxide reductase accessory protein NosL [Rhodospirillales bacterium]